MDAAGDAHIRVGKLNLVDLAGSERQAKTGSTVSERRCPRALTHVSTFRAIGSKKRRVSISRSPFSAMSFLRWSMAILTFPTATRNSLAYCKVTIDTSNATERTRSSFRFVGWKRKDDHDRHTRPDGLQLRRIADDTPVKRRSHER